MEILLEVFNDGLVDNFVLNLCGCIISFINKENERFEEVLLFSEILFIFNSGNLKGVH